LSLLPLSEDGGGLLLSGLGGGLLSVGGGVLLGGGVGLLLGAGLLLVDGGVGQFALMSITDPSGHVLVVGGVDGGTDVNGGVIVDGVNVCVHDGSVGFFVQSTGGGVPVVQLPAAHVNPELFPPDVEVDVLFGGIAADVLLGAGDAAVVVLVKLLAAELTGGRSLAHFNTAMLSFARSPADIHFVTAFSGVSGRSVAQPNTPLLSFATSAADIHFVNALGSVGGHGPV
jgi:hypothetical protein